ncbi:hypothetical protein [Candidatus Hakubella thermalkaliphila]|nr:hypothetical protein [Candidatus Hakubella thermalkaliphila]
MTLRYSEGDTEFPSFLKESPMRRGAPRRMKIMLFSREKTDNINLALR